MQERRGAVQCNYYFTTAATVSIGMWSGFLNLNPPGRFILSGRLLKCSQREKAHQDAAAALKEKEEKSKLAMRAAPRHWK